MKDNRYKNKTRDGDEHRTEGEGPQRAKDANKHGELWRAGALDAASILESHDELLASVGEVERDLGRSHS